MCALNNLTTAVEVTHISIILMLHDMLINMSDINYIIKNTRRF